MRKVRVVLPSVATVAVIVGTLAVSGHAKKPASPPGQSRPEPILVSVAGGIAGEGNPYAIRVAFVDDSFGDLTGPYVSNPDYPPSLKVTGPGRVNKRLRYYYCDGLHDASETMCENSGHDPDHYKCLAIYDGTEDKRTGLVTFPAGSSWRITQKVVSDTGQVSGKLFAEGTLVAPVTYEVLEWGSPPEQ